MTRTGIPLAQKALVAERAGGYCERCGRFLSGAYSFHHRIPRGMGGSRDPLLSHPSNIVLICGSGTTGDHGDIESNRANAYAEGWLLKQTTGGRRTDPRTQPIWLSRFNSWMIPGPGRWFALPERVEAYDDVA